ncbi:MAG: LamG domain-containing protein [Verrucomicrobia bacterium]|nr:LamG domain-containing protein [Verrucomicrobiota bacterium]
MKREITFVFCLIASCSFTAFAADDLIDLTKPPVADAHTLLLLHLDDAKSGIAQDGSERGNHGKINGAKMTEGKFGKALEFDGDDDYVDCGGERGKPPDFDFGDSTDFTVELWIKTTTTNAYSHLINKKCNPAPTHPGFMVYLRGGNVNALIADGVRRIELKHEAKVNDGEWHHLALIAERKANAGLYVDGVAGEAVSMKGLIDLTNPNLTLRIGDRAHDGDFEGAIDEVRISNIARKWK